MKYFILKSCRLWDNAEK